MGDGGVGEGGGGGGKERGWGCTFDDGGEVVDVDVLGFNAFEEVEKDLVWVLVHGIAKKGRVGELPCGRSRRPRSGSEVSRGGEC